MTLRINLEIRAGQTFDEILDVGEVDSSRAQRMHIRSSPSSSLVQCALASDGDPNKLLSPEAGGIRVEIGATISSAWILSKPVVWYYDIEDYDPANADDVIRLCEGRVYVYPETTREADVTPAPGYPSGDARYVRFDGEQALTDPQKAQARTNIGAGEEGAGGGANESAGVDDSLATYSTGFGSSAAQIPIGSLTAGAGNLIECVLDGQITNNGPSAGTLFVQIDNGVAYGSLHLDSTHQLQAFADGISIGVGETKRISISALIVPTDALAASALKAIFTVPFGFGNAATVWWNFLSYRLRSVAGTYAGP